MSTYPFFQITRVLCVALSLCVSAHAQAPNSSPSGQAQPQVTPDPAKVSPPELPKQASSLGTGFAIAPGYLLTAYHVVQQKKQIRVGPVASGTGSTRWLTAELVKADPSVDLALLKIPENLPVLRLHPSASIPVGLEAFVIGYPQPRIQGASRKITSGIVNGYRSVSFNQPESGLLQISAEVSQGNSGGPVLAPDGTVIGMVQKKINPTRVAEKTQDLLVNVNYALRSSQLVDFLRTTDAAYQTQPIQLSNFLRPHVIFEQHQHSVLAVIGWGQPSEAPRSEMEISKERP